MNQQYVDLTQINARSLNQEVLLSIIIPVYNVDKYVDQCLKSLLAQTSNNYLKQCEVIIVNDGSTDFSAEILSRYELTYPCVKVINKSNGGLSDARNLGIENANGFYYAFIDSDDVVDNQFIKIIIDCIQRQEFDILTFNFTKFYLDSDLRKYKHNTTIPDLIKTDAEYYSFKPVFAWNKIYKRSLFINTKFQKGLYYEDVALIPLLIEKAEHHFHLNYNCYYYRQRKGAITFYQDNKYLDILKGVEYLHYNSNSDYINKIIMNQFFTLSLLSLRLPLKSYFSNMKLICDFYSRKFEFSAFMPVPCIRHMPFYLLKGMGRHCIISLLLFKPIVALHNFIKNMRGR
ncbi:glycosyltransferase family 2 protein [Citrobacter amalonaticus]|uniref:glycosyltransferase family 2 protein n=1 Tax=Citrobacter amalonaticus TaxID=35703 RepID=UPI0031F324E3